MKPNNMHIRFQMLDARADHRGRTKQMSTGDGDHFVWRYRHRRSRTRDGGTRQRHSTAIKTGRSYRVSFGLDSAGVTRVSGLHSERA